MPYRRGWVLVFVCVCVHMQIPHGAQCLYNSLTHYTDRRARPHAQVIACSHARPGVNRSHDGASVRTQNASGGGLVARRLWRVERCNIYRTSVARDRSHAV